MDVVQQQPMSGLGSGVSGGAKVQAKAEAARKKAAIKCARKLLEASAALTEFLHACNECNDASKGRGLDDGRVLLMGNISEYAYYLQSVFDK